MNTNAFISGLKLLQDLNVKQMVKKPDRFEISYFFDNKGVVAYGQTEVEVIKNFYELYQEINKEWTI